MTGAARPRRAASDARWAVIAVPYLWLVVFLAVPILIVAKISLATAEIGQPPYSALITWGAGAVIEVRASLSNYALLVGDPLYVHAWVNALRIAAISTILCLILGYPMAYGIARALPITRRVLLMLVIMPFWTSFLIRIYAWIGILKETGPLNEALMALGLIDQPLSILYSETAVYVGMVYGYLPFMILPLYAALERLDGSLLEAAADLGASPLRAFLTVTLPLSVPGIAAGALLVFIPACGEYVIPALLGGPDTLMIGTVLANEFFANRDWPLASAAAITLLVILVPPTLLFQRLRGRDAARAPRGRGDRA